MQPVDNEEFTLSHCLYLHCHSPDRQNDNISILLKGWSWNTLNFSQLNTEDYAAASAGAQTVSTCSHFR